MGRISAVRIAWERPGNWIRVFWIARLTRDAVRPTRA